MHPSPRSLALAMEDFTRRNILLMAIILAIVMAIYLPVSPEILARFDIGGVLVSLIFISQGLKIDFSHAGKITKYLKLVAGGAVVAVIVYPFAAFLMAKLFNLTADHKVGFLLMCSFPNSLEAAMAMSASAGGDPLVAVVLLTSLNIIGLASIPLNLSLWLGGETPVSEYEVLQKLLFYLFIPIGIGQLLRKFFPTLPDKAKHVCHYLPMICITLLVYMSCSKESELFRELKLSDLLHITAPSIILHVAMLIFAFVVARRFLKLEDRSKRSFVLITSEKPMSLSVALWSMSYAQHHPLAIFPIIVFYVGQIIVDSAVVSHMVAKDTEEI